MKRIFSLIAMAIPFLGAMAQLQSIQGPKVVNNTTEHKRVDLLRRSALKPTACKEDTSYFVQYGNLGYRFVTLRSGSSLGQFYGAPQDITVSGFRFFALANAVTPARPVYIRIRCNLYKAGADSLPTGLPLASDTVTVDTTMKSTIYLTDIQFDAKFKNPVTLNYNYILTVECDSTTVTASLITNDWTKGDGRKRNLGCGSVSGKWYRNLQLNISGVAFDADNQLLPFVKYNFGTDFTINNNCYPNLDTVRFTNQQKSNVAGYPYYNYYSYYNLPQFSHRWSYDGGFDNYMVDGKFKPATKKNFNVRLISTVYQYRSGVCNDTTIKTVYFRPGSPVLKRPANFCRGDSASIDLTADAGAVIKWFKKLTDTAIYTGNSYMVKNAQQNDSFWVRAENGPCVSGFVKISVSVNDYPSDPKVKDDYVCLGASANLQATADLGQIDWYNASSGGKSILTGNVLQTGTLMSDTSFYVQANNKGCLNKGGRIKVSALVSNNYAPSKPVLVSDTFACYKAGQDFTLGASGNDTLRWYNQPSGGKPIAFGKDYTFTPSGRGTYDYYVEVWNGICASSREHTTLHVYQPPVLSGKTSPTICSGDSAVFNISIPWGTLNWFNDKNSVTPAYTGTSPVFQQLKTNTTYYLKTAEEQCESAGFDSVKVTVNAPPVPVSVKADPVCAKGAGTFDVNVTSGNVWWYYEDTSSVSFFKGNKIITGPLLSGMTYYYATEKNGCYSARKPLTLTIKPRPTAGFTWQVRWKYTVVCTPITTAGVTFEWNWGDGSKTTGLPGTHQYPAEGNYMVKLVVTSSANGCKDTADIPVLISHVGSNSLSQNALKLYPVPVAAGSKLAVELQENGSFEYSIFNVVGAELVHGISENKGINLPGNLPAGSYFIQIRTVENIYRAKLQVTQP